MVILVKDFVQSVYRPENEMHLAYGTNRVVLPRDDIDEEFYRTFDKGNIEMVFPETGNILKPLAVFHNERIVYPKQ